MMYLKRGTVLFRRLFAAVLTGAVLICGTAACSAKTDSAYPAKQITMIIPYSAGGTTDLIGRQLALAMEQTLGQKIVVENIAGASGSAGARSALNAPADGYTLLFTADSLGTQRVMGISDMSYDDFEPVLAVGDDPKVLVVGKDSPYADAEALLADVAEHPGKIRMSYTGPGGSGHVNALILNRYGYEPALTAYDGGADCLIAVMGKQVDFTNANYSTVADYLESGDLRALAVWGENSMDVCPDAVPLALLIPESAAQMRMPFTPTSLVVPEAVPAEVLKTLRKCAQEAVQDETFDAFMTERRIEKLYERYVTPEDVRAFYTEWESAVSWMLYDAGVTVNSPEKFGIAKP